MIKDIQKDRLIELLEDTLHEWECDVQSETLSQIAEHLIENGVIVLPFKAGDMVYYIHETIYDNEYLRTRANELNLSRIIKVVDRPKWKTNLMLEKIKFDWFLMDAWLRGDIFPTKEVAEQALKERNNGTTQKL